MGKTYRNGTRGDVIVAGIMYRDAIVNRERGRTTVTGRNGVRWVVPTAKEAA